MDSFTMDPAIWRRLPRDLILCLIEASSQKKDLDSWIQATRGDRSLQAAAMKHRWARCEISLHEILAVSKAVGSIRYWPQLERLMQISHGRQPANYIQTIRIWLSSRLRSKPGYKNRLPIHESVQVALNALAPHLTALKEFIVHSPPTRVVLPALKSIGSTIHRLEIDSYCYETILDENSPDEWEFGPIHQTWVDLSPFRNLKSLDLNLVTGEEWVGLTQQISKLCSLEELKVSAFKEELVQGNDAPNGDLSPLEVILSSPEYDPRRNSLGQRCNLLGNLPLSLRQLTIRDLVYFAEDRLIIPYAPATIRKQSRGPALEELHVELTECTSMTSTLSWLPVAALKKISFPAAPYDASNSSNDYTEVVRLVDDIVNKHKDTLQQIILTNVQMACHHLASQFNSTWAGQFEITDLVLNDWVYLRDADCQFLHAHETYSGSSNLSQELKHMLFGCKMDVSRWGSRILRVRLEHEFLPLMNLDESFPLSEFDLPLLRILIITPRPRYHSSEEETSGIVGNILQNATQNLRYISLWSLAYWIDHDQMDGTERESLSSAEDTSGCSSDKRINQDRSKWQTIPWRSAVGGADQRIRSEIFSWLNRDDKDFIDNTSYLNRERECWEVEFVEYYHWQMGNFVVARRCE